jgi:hypothetical protein
MQCLVSCLWAFINFNYGSNLLLPKTLIQVLNMNYQLIGAGSTLPPGAATDLNFL